MHLISVRFYEMGDTWDIITLLSTSGGAGSSPPACTLGRALRGAAVSVAFVLLAGAGAETVPGVLNTLYTQISSNILNLYKTQTEQSSKNKVV